VNTLFNVYPNPNDGNFKIVLSEKITGKISVEIENIVGKLLLKKEYDSLTPGEPLQFEIPDATKGLYLLKVQSEQGSYTQKIIVN
jgi:hypothetical protein